MTAEFYTEYLRKEPMIQRLLYAMNPTKFRCCEYLMRFHEQRGDKVARAPAAALRRRRTPPPPRPRALPCLRTRGAAAALAARAAARAASCSRSHAFRHAPPWTVPSHPR